MCGEYVGACGDGGVLRRDAFCSRECLFFPSRHVNPFKPYSSFLAALMIALGLTRVKLDILQYELLNLMWLPK